MTAIRSPLILKEVTVPDISCDEVLVETRSTGICGTDLHILDGHGYVPPLPHILGHEPAGVVVEVGNHVTDIRVGDRVVPSLFFTCNRCYYCRIGRHQQCANLRGILGVLCPGAFAQYFKAPAQNIFRLPDSISFESGGLIADAVVTAVHAAKRSMLFTGSTAVVIGMGGVGLCLLQVLVAAGIRVIAVDVIEEKVAAAVKYGAKHALLWTETSASEIEQITRPDGVQGVFDCVGSRQTLHEACRIAMDGGRVVVIGEQEESCPVTSTLIAQRELEIVGSRNGTRQDMVEAIRLVEMGLVCPPVAATFPLEHVNQAIQQLRNGGVVGRVVVQVSSN